MKNNVSAALLLTLLMPLMAWISDKSDGLILLLGAIISLAALR